MFWGLTWYEFCPGVQGLQTRACKEDCRQSAYQPGRRTGAMERRTGKPKRRTPRHQRRTIEKEDSHPNRFPTHPTSPSWLMSVHVFPSCNLITDITQRGSCDARNNKRQKYELSLFSMTWTMTKTTSKNLDLHCFSSICGMTTSRVQNCLHCFFSLCGIAGP